MNTKTYQKSLNLYAYIPRHSAHPPGLLRALIISQLSRYHRQCTKLADYAHFAHLLLKRLMKRGYGQKEIEPLFLEVAKRLDRDCDRYDGPLPQRSRDHKHLPRSIQVFHLPFHPGGPNNAEIHNAFRRNCRFRKANGERGLQNPYVAGSITAEHLGVDRLLIARSRPRNIRDHLVPSTLFQALGKRVSRYVAKLRDEE